MIRVLHISDLHLDKEFSLGNSRLAELRKKEQRALFVNLMMYARDKKVDVLLISGDLFDKKMPEKETVALVMREFENMPETEIVISPGQNDPYRPGSLYYKEQFPENVHIFKSEHLSSFRLERLNTTVYGYAFCRRSLKRNPFAVTPPVDRNSYNLLCGYGDLSGKEGICPITEEEIAHSGMDYCAIGHDHQKSELKMAGASYYAVAGSPEGLDFSEHGQRGARIVAMEKEQGKLFLQSKAVRFSRRRYEQLTVDVTGMNSGEEIRDTVLKYIKEEGLDGDTLLELQLTGRIDRFFRMKKQDFDRIREKLCYLETVDRTVMSFEKEITEAKDFKSVYCKMVSESIEEEELRSEVLKCGLGMLEEQ